MPAESAAELKLFNLTFIVPLRRRQHAQNQTDRLEVKHSAFADFDILQQTLLCSSFLLAYLSELHSLKVEVSVQFAQINSFRIAQHSKQKSGRVALGEDYCFEVDSYELQSVDQILVAALAIYLTHLNLVKFDCFNFQSAKSNS